MTRNHDPPRQDTHRAWHTQAYYRCAVHAVRACDNVGTTFDPDSLVAPLTSQAAWLGSTGANWQ